MEPLKPLVALVGNPNAGKTTLFNALTGSHQKVGNYPGVTVEKVSGPLVLSDHTVECTDVPGLYSLQAVSEDERVALGVIEGTVQGTRRPDLLVCVIDATNLERNLYIYHQLADSGQPTIVALTMMDRLHSLGKDVNVDRLGLLLGTEIVPIVGHKEKGIDALRAAIESALEHPHPPHAESEGVTGIERHICELRDRMARLGHEVNSGQVRRWLLSPTPESEAILQGIPELADAFAWSRAQISGGKAPPTEVASRYSWATAIQESVVTTFKERPKSLTDRIDLILTHRVFGLVVFAATMYLVFLSIYSFSQPFMDFIDRGFGWVKDHVRPGLASVPVLQSLVVDGVIGGVGGMLVFLPQIIILFFFIALLEGSGYLARAAFLMDRLLGWCGLNGRAFIPLLSSFACAIPGIMAARVMPDRNSRLATILVSPLMSCSARLPVYLLLIGAFVQPRFGAAWAGFALFAMHLLGLFVAIPIVWFLNRKIIKGKRLPFLLELPPYQWPKAKDVWLTMYYRAKVFVTTAGTTIVLMSLLIWALSYFPRLSPEERAQARSTYVSAHANAPIQDAERQVDQTQLAHSLLGRFGKSIEPVFLPAGFDWRITTSILSAFPARETVVPSLGIIFALGGDKDRLEHSDDLRNSLQHATWPDGRPLFTAWTAVGLMVFFALCAQCMATLATVRRETNSWKWPVFMFSYMTGLAYIGAVVVHQLSLLFSK
jgi:ferrous iron transport protein B